MEKMAFCILSAICNSVNTLGFGEKEIFTRILQRKKGYTLSGKWWPVEWNYKNDTSMCSINHSEEVFFMNK